MVTSGPCYLTFELSKGLPGTTPMSCELSHNVDGFSKLSLYYYIWVCTDEGDYL